MLLFALLRPPVQELLRRSRGLDRRRARVAALAAIAAWTLFAFGGAYLWTIFPLVLGSLALALIVQPSIAPRGFRVLDAAIVACLLAACLQIVPWPPRLRLAVGPGLASMDRALTFDAANGGSGQARPLAVDQQGAIEWLVLAATVVVYFWCARQIVSGGGARHVVRAITACGAIVAAIALLQHMTAPHSLYWVWHPVSRGAEYPFGPFVNRNDMAAWMVMALPLAAGYMLARLEVRRRDGRLNRRDGFRRDGRVGDAGDLRDDGGPGGDVVRDRA